MENGAFAPMRKCSISHNIFKNMIFQRHQGIHDILSDSLLVDDLYEISSNNLF